MNQQQTKNFVIKMPKTDWAFMKKLSVDEDVSLNELFLRLVKEKIGKLTNKEKK